AETNDIFWHKNDIHKTIIDVFGKEPPQELEQRIHENALYAKGIIKEWVEKNNIDLIIAHNTSHPYNFITAVGLGYYIDELRSEGTIWPKFMVWWHDSYFEREKFKHPNQVIAKYLKYLPGTNIDGIAFINNSQPALAKRLFASCNQKVQDVFFKERTIVVPNTSDIPWDWQDQDWAGDAPVFPKQDNYNDSFLADIGLECEVFKRGFGLKDTVILLQHTRVVPRKKIELAIDFAFSLEQRYLKDGQNKCVCVLVSGHSGDEQEEYKKYLVEYIALERQARPGSNVILIFGEQHILSHRDIIVDKKYYKFAEVPAIVARHAGIGTYFSEVEGYGNNLLEMMSLGLPVLINKYEVFKTDIEHLGFALPAIEDGILTDALVEKAYQILNNPKERNWMVQHNLKTLHKHLDHKIIARLMAPLIQKMFTKILDR
ncbi:MAG: glycosyltransferase family 4 protein, partial [Bacteroidales bacterium]|nr:glycosyltransferase family 4 protein [Bacteroidales bacterium]